MRKQLSLLAAAGLIALGSAVPAGAAEPQYILTGQPEVFLKPYPKSGSPAPYRLGFGVSYLVPETPEDIPFDVTYRLDLSKLRGIADATLPAGSENKGCTLTGTVVVCERKQSYPIREGVAVLNLTAAQGTKGGETGEITVTGVAAGTTFAPRTAKVTVSDGPDLAVADLPLDTKPEVGEQQALRPAFTNKGTKPVKAVRLSLQASRGLDLLGRYGNCTATEQSHLSCTLEGDFQPGVTYEVSSETAIGLKANTRAFRETLDYAAHAAPAPATPGAGPLLKAVPRAAALRSADPDVNPEDNTRRVRLSVANTADLSADETVLAGKPGETVKARLGFRNNGPAWIDHSVDNPEDSGSPVAFLDVRLPEGVSVVKKSTACETRSDLPNGGIRHLCRSGISLSENAKVGFPFELKIDKAVAGAKGSVTVLGDEHGYSLPAWDRNPANNTAAVTVNTAGTSPSPSTSPSPGASQSPGTGTPTPTGSASPSASGTSTPTPAASATGNGNSTTPQGGLANTGSSVVPFAAASAAIVAAGAALFVVFRRRTGRA
ncbi:hypothetical protein [Streptomyces sp. NPDC002054]|uniref:hypothetical protein n=1 Tax=Streptomyces sp. NPDC002054 TaxID=3154663 RepID=UPI0033243691